MFNFLAGSLDPTPFFPTSGLTIKFDWFTIAYLAIIVISVIVGIKRGLIYSLLSLVSGIVAVGIAFLIAKPVGGWCYNAWGGDLAGKISDWLVSKNADFGNPFDATASDAVNTLGSMLQGAGIPTIVCGLLAKLVLKVIPAENNVVVSTYAGEAAARYAFIIAAAIIFTIIIWVVTAILKKIIKAKREDDIHTFGEAVDSIFGAVGGLVIGLMIVSVISFGLTFLATVPACTGFINSQLYLDDDTVWTFGKALYNYNLIGTLMNLYILA
ncbi:MAG: CvpA family protein [Bacilli bacterium]|nr:CvpA family protein [Bacilli bacterium]